MPANTNGRNPIDDEAVKAKIPVAAKARPGTDHFRKDLALGERSKELGIRNTIGIAKVGAQNTHCV